MSMKLKDFLGRLRTISYLPLIERYRRYQTFDYDRAGRFVGGFLVLL